VLRIRIGFKEDPDPALKFYADPGLLKFFDQKKVQFTVFISMTSKPQKKPSALKRDQPALRNMGNFFIFSYFYGPFLSSWIRIQPTKMKVDPCGSGSATLLERRQI
jgi:hypothetical protein